MYLSEILSWLKEAEHKRLGTEWFHSLEVLEGEKNSKQKKKKIQTVIASKTFKKE